MSCNCLLDITEKLKNKIEESLGYDFIDAKAQFKDKAWNITGDDHSFLVGMKF